MEIVAPFQNDFTVYSKSGCSNCLIVKSLIKEKNLFFKEINCDEYILENKNEFLNFIESKSGNAYKTFPIVFFNEKFVGGLNETMQFIDKLLLSFEDIF